MSTLIAQSSMPHKPILPLCVCGDPLCKIPYGYCHCGCGGMSPIAKRTYKKNKVRTGQPYRYIFQHGKIVRPAIDDAKPFKMDGVYCRLIPLSGGYYAIVWESDYAWLMQWKWSASGNPKVGIYAARNVTVGGKLVCIKMHRLIMNAPNGVEVDHRFGNKLDNRRSVLRFANDADQARNRKKHRNNTSGYIGVSKHKDRWRADIMVCGTRKYLGSRALPEDSARLYDTAAVKYFGEFARLNFPESRG